MPPGTIAPTALADRVIGVDVSAGLSAMMGDEGFIEGMAPISLIDIRVGVGALLRTASSGSSG